MYALLFAILVVGADAKEDEVQKELAKLQGVWKVKAIEQSGRQIELPRIAGGSHRIDMVIVDEEYCHGTHAGVLLPDPTKQTFQLSVKIGINKGQKYLGIYELRGDTLRLAYDFGPLPMEFKNVRGPIFTFERDTKGTKEEASFLMTEKKDAIAKQPAQPQRGVPRVADEASTVELLILISNQLERIERRLDAIERKTKPQ